MHRQSGALFSSQAIAIKSEGQQAILALHRMRQQLIKFRTMQSNGLRGTEYGEIMALGRAALNKAIPGIGLLSATATLVTMGDAKAFKSGREFAAWLGRRPNKRAQVGGYAY